jgi:Flp pilus assembly protein TadD
LLGEQPETRTEALACIDRAIDLVGPQATLLDTKGMIYVYQQQPEKAVECLETAARGPGSDPRFLFHLAVAYQRIGESDKAREALKKAHDGYLTRRLLTETDQQMLIELERQLAN